MKNLLFISFDLIRDGEPGISLSAASLVAYLRQADSYEKQFRLRHQTIDCYKLKSNMESFDEVLNALTIGDFDGIAMSCHIWSESYVKYFIQKIRGLKWNGIIILGGPQMNDTEENLKARYNQANVFIQGYGEQSFLAVCENLCEYYRKTSLVAIKTFSELIPAVYSSGIIEINEFQDMVRLETKRNCPYRCSFCHFTDYTTDKVSCLNLTTVKQEIKYLMEKKVRKVNIMDPTFNILNYEKVIEFIAKIGYQGLFTFQAHFNVLQPNPEKIIDLFRSINSHLEFGLQCTNPLTLSAINRNINLKHIKEAISKMVERNVSFEISLIYGLPFQTLQHFKDSVSLLKDLGVGNIYGYPLQLYQGTQLFRQRNEYEIKSKPNNLGIEQVTGTKWMRAKDIEYLNNWTLTKTK